MSPSATDLLLRLIDESYEKSAWQGPSLRGSLRGVTPAQAAWRPAPGRHNIAELVVHAAYWKYAVWRMLAGGKRGAFSEKGSNWFPRSGPPNERAWRAEVANLDAHHRKLRDVVAALAPSDLGRKPAGSKRTTDTLVYGVASHDVYHTGQIQILKRLWRDRKSGGRR